MKNRSLFSYLRSHEKPQAEKRNPILHYTFFIIHSSFYILHLINLQKSQSRQRDFSLFTFNSKV